MPPGISIRRGSLQDPHSRGERGHGDSFVHAMEHGGEIITRGSCSGTNPKLRCPAGRVLAVGTDRQAGRHDRGTRVLLLDRDPDGIGNGAGEAGLHRPSCLNDLDVDQITDELPYLCQQLGLVSRHVTAVDARLSPGRDDIVLPRQWCCCKV